MQHYFRRIDQMTDLGDILRFAGDICKQNGVIRESYHLTPLFETPNSTQTLVYAVGFDPDWIELYERSDFRHADPIPERTLDQGTLLTWADAQQISANTDANADYFRAMQEYGLTTGFGLPLYGPGMRNSYSSFDFGVPIWDVEDSQIAVVRGVAQAAHQRISFLIKKESPPVSFSDRETEVLCWMAAGKSVSSIATILNISPATVKTYTTRIYDKLEVADRVSAVVKALKMGLVHV